jgi:hypothetical protein
MILDLSLARYAVDAITQEKKGNTERGVVVLHSITEVESVCAVRILMVRSFLGVCNSSSRSEPQQQQQGKESPSTRKHHVVQAPGRVQHAVHSSHTRAATRHSDRQQQ